EGNDIWIVDRRAYVLDNGGQIVMVDADSLKKIGSISLGITQPNKMALVAPKKFIITERGGRTAKIVDVNGGTSVESLSMPDGNVCAGVLGGKIFITSEPSPSRGSLSVFDVATNALVNTVSLDANPEGLVVDSAHNQIIVGCSGDYNTVGPSAVFIDPATLTIKKTVSIGVV